MRGAGMHEAGMRVRDAGQGCGVGMRGAEMRGAMMLCLCGPPQRGTFPGNDPIHFPLVPPGR